MIIERFESTLARPLRLALSLAALLTITPGCDGDDEGDDEAADTGETETGETETGETETGTDTGEEAPAIAGTYTDEWGDTHTIDASTWTNGAGVFHVDQWDDEAMWLVAQNDEANMYSPSLWSRFDWVWSADDLYYCQSVFDGATVEVALAGSANRDDIMLGCGGFAWTNLTP
ncbi:hypothetical protein ACNOYE_33670 [Nannocystaceae bacterium ST9]